MIERRSKRNQPIPRHPSISRLQSDHAAKRRRLPNRSASIGAQRRHRHVRGHRRRRSTGRSARHAALVARIMHRAIRRVLRGRAHGKLIAIKLAQNHRARRFQASHRRAVIRRNEIVENLRTGGSAHAAVTMTSLIATGTPASGGKGWPSAAIWSISAACLSARSSQRVKNAPISESSFRMRCRNPRASAVAVVFSSIIACEHRQSSNPAPSSSITISVTISQSLSEPQKMSRQYPEHSAPQRRAATISADHP